MLFITTKDTKSTKVKTEDSKGQVFCSFFASFASFVLFVVDRLFLCPFNGLEVNYLEAPQAGSRPNI